VQEGTTAHFLELGFPCRAGVDAGLLVQRGATARADIIEFPGGFCSVLVGEEHCDYDEMVKGLGESYVILSPEIRIKKYPCCFANHMALDGFFSLLKEEKVQREEVESIEVGVNGYIARWLRHPDPKTGDEAKFSLEHTLATALLQGRVWVDAFTDAFVRSAEAREARQRIKVVRHEEWPAERAAMRVRLEIRLKNGRRHIKEVNRVSEPTRDEQMRRYADLASKRLTPRQVERSLDLMLNLEKLENIAELTEMITYPERK
jgi:2-methylcitrate dehydratase PrpD